jgi:hypothetical protein
MENFAYALKESVALIAPIFTKLIVSYQNSTEIQGIGFHSDLSTKGEIARSNSFAPLGKESLSLSQFTRKLR